MEHAGMPADLQTNMPPGITEEFLNALRVFWVVEASIFGSMIRGDARADSGIDLMVRFRKDGTLFRQMELASELERVSGRHFGRISYRRSSVCHYDEVICAPRRADPPLEEELPPFFSLSTEDVNETP